MIDHVDPESATPFEPMRPRAVARRSHVHRRSKERLGITMSEAELNAIEASLRDRRGRFVHRADHGVSFWDVILRGRWVRVVFDHEHDELVTVLPDDTRVKPARRRA